MCNRTCCQTRGLLLLLLSAAATPAVTQASTFELYMQRPDREFTLPTIASQSGTFQGGTLIDNLPDGRLLLITTRDLGSFFGPAELRVETAVGSHTFNYVGDLPLPTVDQIWWNPGGFLTINKTTGLAAVGNSSYSVGVFDTADLDSLPSVTWYDALGFQLSATRNSVAAAAWRDNTHLAVALGDFSAGSQLNLLDVTSSVSSPAAPLVIDNAPSGTGGVAFDAQGNVFFGVGLSDGQGNNVGDIRQFSTAGWPATQQFSTGSLFTNQLSAAWPQFDNEGNLLVGGGVFDSQTFALTTNFFAIVDPTGQVRTFDGDPAPHNYYNVAYNEATGEILAWDNYGSDPQHVYFFAAEALSVPEPSSLALFAAAAATLSAVWARRRRRESRTGQ